MRVCIYMYYVCMGSFEKIKTVRVLLADINLIFAPTPVEHFLHRFQQGLKLEEKKHVFVSSVCHQIKRYLESDIVCGIT